MVKVLEVDFELVVGAFDEVVEVEAIEVVHFGLPVVVIVLIEILDIVALEVVLVVKVLRVDWILFVSLVVFFSDAFADLLTFDDDAVVVVVFVVDDGIFVVNDDVVIVIDDDKDKDDSVVVVVDGDGDGDDFDVVVDVNEDEDDVIEVLELLMVDVVGDEADELLVGDVVTEEIVWRLEVDEVCVESVNVVVVLFAEVVLGLEAPAHKRGGLESYPVRILFTAA